MHSRSLKCTQWDVTIFSLLASSGRTDVDINAADEGFNILHHLSADKHRRTRLGSAFSSELFRGHPDEVRAKLDGIVSTAKLLGANLNHLTTTTTSAARSSHVDVVEALLKHGADADFQNEAGETALLHCRLNRQPQTKLARCVELLVSHGANIEHQSPKGRTPLFSVGFWPLAANILLSKGANMQLVEDERQWSVWFLLVSHEHDPLSCEHGHRVAELVEKHLCSSHDMPMFKRVTDHATKDGDTMLHKFATCGMHRTVATLLKKGAFPNNLRRRNDRRTENGERVTYINYWTPIDEAEYKRKQQAKDAEQFITQHTREEYEAVCKKYSTVIEVLREYGGQTGQTVVGRESQREHV
ncbi:ankyrin repeat-containing domain protein [Phaeosphaeriaceae sp. PMI808]|nr:ankyrin repeat-containing domain protein [Phaeosphaeriaceae sp. PMI808]